MTVLVTGCTQREGEAPAINHDAYIWQRRWDDSLLKALRDAAPSIRAWRVLAAEVDSQGNVVKMPVNREALAQTGNPVIAVIRIKTLAVDKVAEVVAGWKVSGIEIDYDCATSQLPAYRNFLPALRRRIAPEMTLSITALPSWLGSGDLVALLNEVDESVLQVHSVMNAKKGLFDSHTAHEWARQWSEISPKPFRVALPTYWSRVSWNQNGNVTAIESEVTRYGVDDSASRELFVEPGEVSAWVAELRKTPLRHLSGLAWFRLPTGEAQRAWNFTTWRAVMQGQILRPTAPLVRIQAERTGVSDVYLRNKGAFDGRLPTEVRVKSHGCVFADSLPPYDFDRNADGVNFRILAGAGALPAGREKLVGWVRCPGQKLETSVSVE